jgi:hypothetical protein
MKCLTHLNSPICASAGQPTAVDPVFPSKIHHRLVSVSAPDSANGFMLVSQVITLYRSVLQPDQEVVGGLWGECEGGDGDRVFEVFPDRRFSLTQVLTKSDGLTRNGDDLPITLLDLLSLL